MLIDIGYADIHQKSEVLGDNKPAICSVGNDSVKSRTKHLDVRLKFCGEVIKQSLMKIKYIPTAKNIAEMFTKPLPSPRFRMLRNSLVKDVSQYFDGHNQQEPNYMKVKT